MRKGQSRIHTCDFCGYGFDLSFLCGSVRETGKSMLCVQLIERTDCVSGVEGRISTTKDRGGGKETEHVARIVRTFELCISQDGLYSVRNIHPGGTNVRDG